MLHLIHLCQQLKTFKIVSQKSIYQIESIIVYLNEEVIIPNQKFPAACIF